MPISLDQLNQFDQPAFIRICGPLFEYSQWIAERTWKNQPFPNLQSLHSALCETMYAATADEQLQLISAHPDLVGRLARQGKLTPQSSHEQSVAGLTKLTTDEIAVFDRYNAEYRAKFNFPFIICARENKKDAILTAFPIRLANTVQHEIQTALAEIAKIAKLRLLDAVIEDSMTAVLSTNSYGKSNVRLTKVTRHPDRHDLTEISVDIELHGQFDRSYTHGDNSSIVATDTMKNTVYALAKDHPLHDIESFAIHLAKHFVTNNAHVTAAEIHITQDGWQRIPVNGKLHRHSFVSSGNEKRTTHVIQNRNKTTISSGIADLVVLKTTQSGFVGFLRDPYTTLPETTDRIFATTVNATWNYTSDSADWNTDFTNIRQALLDVFADHESLAVQQTLFAMGESALKISPDISEIELTMPNQHRLLVNLKPFNQHNPNEIFVPTNEPFGLIKGTIKRK